MSTNTTDDLERKISDLEKSISKMESRISFLESQSKMSFWIPVIAIALSVSSLASLLVHLFLSF